MRALLVVQAEEICRVLKDRAKTALTKKARKGFSGYPLATVVFYGPTDGKATKLVGGIL